MTEEFDLLHIFKAVSETLKTNEASLNEADTRNHDHGTNMVNTFKLIEKAVKAKENESASAQLAYASQMVRKNSSSGSALLYADGLKNASTEFEGKTFDRSGVGTLLNSLMGVPQSQAQTQAPEQVTPQGGDFLSTLIGGLASDQNQPSAQSQEPHRPLSRHLTLSTGLVGSLLRKNLWSLKRNKPQLNQLAKIPQPIWLLHF